MSILALLIPLALGIGLLWLGIFVWTMRSGQYEDLQGAALRVLEDQPPISDIQMHKGEQ